MDKSSFYLNNPYWLYTTLNVEERNGTSVNQKEISIL